MVFLLLITWVQALLLLVLQTMFTGSLDFVREHAFLLPAVTAYGFLQSLVAAITIVALSSLSTSARYVGILYAGAVIFTGSMFTVLRGVTGSSAWSWISFTASQEQVGDVIFGADPRYDTPWGISLLIVVALIALSVWILGRRVRGVEVCVVSVVAARGLSKWYGEVIGLNDVTVNIPPGISGLLGPNGAGKSTLLKLVTGQLRPSQGRSTCWASRSGGIPPRSAASATARTTTAATTG